MKTLKSTGPLLLSVQTDKSEGVPKGKVQVMMVRYETLEIDVADFGTMNFQVHDANCPEAKVIAKLVKS